MDPDLENLFQLRAAADKADPDWRKKPLMPIDPVPAERRAEVAGVVAKLTEGELKGLKEGSGESARPIFGQSTYHTPFSRGRCVNSTDIAFIEPVLEGFVGHEGDEHFDARLADTQGGALVAGFTLCDGVREIGDVPAQLMNLAHVGRPDDKGSDLRDIPWEGPGGARQLVRMRLNAVRTENLTVAGDIRKGWLLNSLEISAGRIAQTKLTRALELVGQAVDIDTADEEKAKFVAALQPVLLGLQGQLAVIDRRQDLVCTVDESYARAVKRGAVIPNPNDGGQTKIYHPQLGFPPTVAEWRRNMMGNLIACAGQEDPNLVMARLTKLKEIFDRLATGAPADVATAVAQAIDALIPEQKNVATPTTVH